MPDFDPMLADRGLPRRDLAGWSAEPKLDGELVAGAGTAGDFYGLLPHLVGRRHAGPPAAVSRSAGPDAPDLLSTCADHDVEGIVLKRLRSIYRPGDRTCHWRKLKTPDSSTTHRPRRRPQDPPAPG